MIRDAIFRANPGFAHYLAVALQDAQYSEADEACVDERDPRDTGTIYTVDGFDDALTAWQAFVARCGEDAQTWANGYGWDSFGGDAYLTAAGHGAGFWDRGAGELGERLTACCVNLPTDVYFGDDGKVYLS